MKKRVVAAALGIMLSLSMGLQAGAEALDGGFDSGFISEQPAEEPQTDDSVPSGNLQTDDSTSSGNPQTDDSTSSDNPQTDNSISSDNPQTDADIPSDNQQNDSNVSSGEETVAAGETDDFVSGFISAGEDTQLDTELQVQSFEDGNSVEATEISDDVPEVGAAATATVVKWTDWEQTSDGRFRLHKKTSKSASAVQSADVQQVSAAEFEGMPVIDTTQVEEVQSAQPVDEIQDVQDAQEAVGQANTQNSYYTAADGIVLITTKTEKGKRHTSRYLFDADGYLMTGLVTVDKNFSPKVAAGEYYFSTVADAQAYGEYKSQNAEMVPWKSSVGRQKRKCWIWMRDSKAFHYFGTDGKGIRVSQLNKTAKANNTYTGYFKIKGEYYCLDAKGAPRTGNITLKVNGVSSKYYFQPASSADEIPGKMFHDGWLKLKGKKGELWRYYNTGKTDKTQIGKLVNHGTMLTDLDGKKKAGTTYLLGKNGYIVKNGMNKATDGKVYLTDKYGRPYKNRIVTYKNKQYYVTKTGARASWKNCWHRCPDLNNRLYYFGSTPGCIVKKTGWQKVVLNNGNFYGWFLFSDKGIIYANRLKDDCYLKADGRIASGLVTLNGNTYFFKPSTSETRNGQMVRDQLFIYQGNTYYADANGVLCTNGWQYINGRWYCFKNMISVTNDFVEKDGTYGYLDGDGNFITGWVIADNSKNLVRYINPDAPGYVTNSSKWIDGKLYYFDSDGYRINDVTDKYAGPYTVEVDRVNGVMTVYADSARTIPVKSIRVSVGNPGTPTPKGTYRLTRYSRWQALMGPSWGQYGTHVDNAGEGGIFVHSIACGAANSYNLPVSAYYRLGSPASHGCIRACVGDAKWVYDNCNGATIHIFDGTYKADEVFKGPLGRRAIVPLQGMKNGGYYDPTDPNA